MLGGVRCGGGWVVAACLFSHWPLLGHTSFFYVCRRCWRCGVGAVVGASAGAVPLLLAAGCTSFSVSLSSVVWCVHGGLPMVLAFPPLSASLTPLLSISMTIKNGI